MFPKLPKMSHLVCKNKKPDSKCKKWKKLCKDGEWGNWLKKNCEKTCGFCGITIAYSCFCSILKFSVH